MTKQEVLDDMAKLYDDIDKWSIIRTTQGMVSELIAERLLLQAQQELSFLMDYIKENVKEQEEQI